MDLYEKLTPRHQTQIDAIKEHITSNSLTEEIMMQFSNFTRHDMAHFRQVAKNASLLCKPLVLSHEEIFCLLAACYCHDLGMAHTDAQLAYDMQYRDDIRRWHAHYSSIYIHNELPRNCILEEGLRIVIAKISAGHGRWDWQSEYFEPAYGIRVRLLTAILSLADALDLRGERKNPRDFPGETSLLEYPFLKEQIEHNPAIKKNPALAHLSRVHWLRHYYSLEPSIEVLEDDTIRITLVARIGMSKKNPQKAIQRHERRLKFP